MAIDSLTYDPLLANLIKDSVNFESSMNTLHRKQTGSYYTSLELTLIMMQELVESFDIPIQRKLYTLKFLEPCVGTGNFVFAYLRVCNSLKFTHEENIELINNIFVCDINKQALNIYKKNLGLIAKQWFDIELNDKYFATHIGKGLLFDVDTDKIQYTPITDVFNSEIIGRGFDIVVTNPPYKNLKAERGHYQTDSQYIKDKDKYNTIGKLAVNNLTYSISGTLNLYKLFVEEILERYLSETGTCSLLIPSSILSDKTCAKMRTHILQTCSIQSLRLISENSDYVDASQALCAVLLHKGRKTQNIYIDGSFSSNLNQGEYVSIDDITDKSTGNAILVLTKNEYSIRKKMKSHPVIKEISYIDNLRGELDITLNKKAIVETETPYRFFRGRHIGYYRTIELSKKEYVSETFVQLATKQQYIHRIRLACQQIVNLAKKRRISFTLIPENSVLGNSCNFISVRPNNDGVDIYYLIGVLNSTLIDWYFKLTSSNNHINNYEIDNFPIPITYDRKSEIAELVKQYFQSNNDSLLSQIDALVYDAYGIALGDKGTTEDVRYSQDIQPKNISIFKSKEAVINYFYRDLMFLIPSITEQECISILEGRATVEDISFQKKTDASKFDKKVLANIEKKYKQLYAGKVLNHTTSKLSELDLEMIRPIPPGGNWKDIPLEIVQKSKRLARIKQTGGRTTLYGRIDYEKPSYTITTYFNRPGNGTYVHPVHERVISVREAARLQSFPDDYLFCGNKSDMLKQVGNAVPVLLAYNIGKSIREKTECCTSVDLFSGAGGMTYGFKQAGINAVIANDIIESACITLKTNSPDTPVLCGDITNEEIKRRIIKASVNAGADIICGGPPCQGFSMAGFRMKNDPRNELFRHFVDIVSEVNPKVIVFENVEGILSYQNGETYRNIIYLFSDLGYHTEGRKLLVNHYGIPQRRKRVIIICTRKDIGVMPGDIYPTPITPNTASQVTVRETIFDLENIECSEYAVYGSSYTSPMIKYLKNEISIDHYIALIKKRQSVIENHNVNAIKCESDSSKSDQYNIIQLSLFEGN